jgi:hypothetical protein
MPDDTTPASTLPATEGGSVSPASTATSVPAPAAVGEGQPNTSTAATTPPASTPATPSTPPATATPPAADGVPEKYEFTAPEGTTLQPEAIAAYSGIAKELGLSQAKAQQLINGVLPSMAKAQQAQIDALNKGWMEAAKADKEYGGEAFEANLAVAKSAMEKVGTPELRDYLNQSGLGNHPEMVRLFVRLGKQVLPDQNLVGGAGGGKPSSGSDAAQQIYGDVM